MILIVGLGNPGKRYERSRHNLGFLVVDRLAERLQAPPWKVQARAEALVTRGVHGGRGFLLAKPQTFMNNSGRAVASLLHYYEIALADCLVIVDDLELEPGRIRQRNEGSDGGHRGLRSIIGALGSQGFKRIRLGIGRPSSRQTVTAFVLGRSREEGEAMDRAVALATDRVMDYLETGTFDNWSSS
jgi:PTH1 family peptidyl-tRNA hydrolase